MHDIHLIVDRLREYKFEEDLTLVTFGTVCLGCTLFLFSLGGFFFPSSSLCASNTRRHARDYAAYYSLRGD